MANYGDEYEYEWPDDGDGDANWGNDDGDQEEDGPWVQIENNFYEAEGNFKDSPQEALEQFEQCVKLEEEQGDEIKYRFQATEKIIILAARLQQFQKMKDNQKKMLGMMGKVARNAVSDAINNILDAVSKHIENMPNEQSQMYNMILDILKD